MGNSTSKNFTLREFAGLSKDIQNCILEEPNTHTKRDSRSDDYLKPCQQITNGNLCPFYYVEKGNARCTRPDYGRDIHLIPELKTIVDKYDAVDNDDDDAVDQDEEITLDDDLDKTDSSLDGIYPIKFEEG